MPDYAVGTRFTARDQVTQTYERMGRAADNFRRRTSSAFRNATKEGYKFGTVVKGILAANAIRAGIGYVTTGVQTAARSFIDFDDAIVAAAARFDDIGPKATNFAERVAGLKAGARGAAGVKYQLVETATALDTLAKAGYTSTAALGVMPSMMDLARASGEDFAQTVSMSNDLLGAFRLSSTNAQVQIANQSKLNDILAKSGLDANGELKDMFETMKMVGPVSKTAGMGIEEVVAMAVALSNSGIKGTQAATALKHAILNIPSARMAEEFKANGIVIADGAGNIRKYSTILSEIGAKISKLGNREQTQILERIFGLYGIAGGTNLVNNLQSVATSEDRLKKAAGTGKEVADVMEKYSLKIKLAKLANASLEKTFSVFDAFEYQGKRGVDAMVTAIGKWNPEGLIVGLRATGVALSAMWSAIKPLMPVLPYLIGYFMAFNGVLKVMQLGSAVIMFFRLVKAMSLAIGLMPALNLLMAANPVGAIASGIALLVVGLVYLEKRFKLFSTAWDFWGKKVKEFINWISGTTFWKIVSGIGGGLAGFGKALFSMKIPGLEQFAAGSQQEPEAPNKKEAEARQATWQGQLTIAGATPGSTFSQKSTGAPAMRWNMLGANP